MGRDWEEGCGGWEKLEPLVPEAENASKSNVKML